MIGIEQAQGKVDHVGKLCIYVTPDGKLIAPMGSCRVCVSPAEAKAMLDNLFIQAGQFASHAVTASNGNVPASR